MDTVWAGDERLGLRRGLVGVGDELSGSTGHGGGGTRAIRLELTRLGMRRAVGLERTWLE